EVIERNAMAQAQLIDDLLDVSRIVHGKLSIEVSRLDAVAVVEAALDAVRPAADVKGVQLELTRASEALMVMADAGRLRQIVSNLLTNAVKFTPGGGKIQVTVRGADASMEISVEDTGKGIAPAFLPHVFERFRQADVSATRVHGGLGLGLSIVHYLV